MEYIFTIAGQKQSPILTQKHLTLDDLKTLSENPTHWKTKEDILLILPYSHKTENYEPAVYWDDGESVHIVSDNGETKIRRCKDNALLKYAEILDFDSGYTIDEFTHDYKELWWVAYPSPSHLKDGSTQKFRVIVPYAHPVPALDVWNKSQAIQALFSDTDPCFVTYRGQNLPAYTDDSYINPDNWWYVHNDGELLDLSSLDDNPTTTSFTPREYTPVDDSKRELILEKLIECSVDHYTDLLYVIPAMVNEDYSEGDMLSVCARRCCRYRQQEVIAAIRNFSNKAGYCTGNTGTLINYIRRTDPDFMKPVSKRRARINALQEYKKKMGNGVK